MYGTTFTNIRCHIIACIGSAFRPQRQEDVVYKALSPSLREHDLAKQRPGYGRYLCTNRTELDSVPFEALKERWRDASASMYIQYTSWLQRGNATMNVIMLL